MNGFFHNLRLFLARLSTGQRIALLVVIVGGVVVLSGIASWAGRPDFALLFGRLDPTDANKVVESLRAQGTKFELQDGGTAIFVPRDEVYELRLRFAGEGLISQGPAGYELFDQGTLGMTDFMQKLNMRRALEGELSRTVSSIKQVETARVHLVVPERSPFRDAQTEPSASVVLQLAGGNRLESEHIQGITALVAGAVEGLSPTDVTVLDTRGNLLSDPQANNPRATAGTTQLRMQQTVEAHLVDKGQSMLDRVLGTGNAIVRVAATLDFDRTVSEREIIDPESATVISEEELEENDVGGTGSASSAIRNYDLNRTHERLEEGVGEIKFMTVSVILNQRLAENEEGEELEARPYAPEEIAEIEALVKNAVGFNADRGDRIAVTQTQFDTTFDHRIATQIDEQRETERTALYLRYGLMLLALIVAAWLLRSASKNVKFDGLPATAQLGAPAPPAPSVAGPTMAGQLGAPEELEGAEEEGVLVDDVYTSKLSPDARRRLKAKHLMYEEIKNQVTSQPEDTAELIRSWIVSDARASH